MSAERIVMLAIGAVIFTAWAALMFRMLFLLRKRAEEESGKPFPGPGETMNHWGRFFRGKRDRKLRQWLTGLTMALFVWMIGLALLTA